MVTAAATGAAVALRRRGTQDGDGQAAPSAPSAGHAGPPATGTTPPNGNEPTPAPEDVARALDAARERLRRSADARPGTPHAA